ncbi:MAG TPA: polysaccharide deacetylase family protein [Longimicrobiales bacterium]|nr:polysaccharide deacetylase family protein [Longimicrobiales bacterium]
MLRVLTYHRIGNPADTPDLDPQLVSALPEVFEQQMEHLRRWYLPLELSEIIEAFKTGRPLPDRAVHVTVDDAYRDFAEIAWPVLKRLEIPVTVFVPTAFPGEEMSSFWWDRLHRSGIESESNSWSQRLEGVEAVAKASNGRPGKAELRDLLRRLPPDLAESIMDEACLEPTPAGEADAVATRQAAVLSWDELRELQADGVTFGAHTRHHVALPFVDLASIRQEIRRSLEDLTRELGEGPWSIAYPYGMCNATVARVAEEEGCVLGFTCEDGLNRPGMTDPLRLRRSNITLRTSPSVFAIRMLPWCARVDRWRHRHERILPAT